MGLIDGKNSKASKASSPVSVPENKDFLNSNPEIATTSHTPRFMPGGLMDLGLCSSEEELAKTKKALADFKQIAAWTKQKFAMQASASQIALELAKSQNALVAEFAKTALKQAKSDADLNSLLQAMPGMLAAIQGQVTKNKEIKLKSFVERLNAAGKSSPALNGKK